MVWRRVFKPTHELMCEGLPERPVREHQLLRLLTLRTPHSPPLGPLRGGAGTNQGEMSWGLSYADALKLARKAAPLLDISVSKFMRLRKND